MIDISARINSYVAASSEAKLMLEGALGMRLDNTDIQRALQDVLELTDPNPAHLLNYNLTAERIVELLREYDFRRTKPTILATIELDEPLIPAGVTRLLNEQTVKVGGEIWRIHKNDADPFPSTPHAHNLETGIVLHLGTGELFDKKRKFLRNIGCKSLLEVRRRLGDMALPPTTCK